ncbi:unnamed protein product [Urochloa decumbens]|uniref:Uncharacterized protein n=1 Tax=Urochloa decumbens TaxID=240449 RepID=A0ABC9CIJ8_9POAL
MEATKASLAENPVTGAVPADAKPPVMVVLERARDGTWIATPDYAEGGDEQARPPCLVVPDGGHHGNHEVDVSFRAHKMRLASDPHAKRRRTLAMFRGEDERARDMITLPFAGLLLEEPIDEAAAELLLLQTGDADASGSGEAGTGGGGEEEGPLRFVKKELSAAGFVDARHMRMSISAFFDPYIDVDDEGEDDEIDTGFRASFMFAMGFVNRLWDVRRIVEAFMDDGLDLEARRETIARRLGELEEVLDARARAVSTGRIKLTDYLLLARISFEPISKSPCQL